MVMVNIELQRMRNAAELDKDMAHATNSKPINGVIFREGKSLMVYIYTCWKDEAGILVSHVIDPESGDLVSRGVFRSGDELIKVFGVIGEI